MGEIHLCSQKTANKYPQESYAAVDHVVQADWIFHQCVTKERLKAFMGLEKFCGKPFCLLFSLEIGILPPNCRISRCISSEEIRSGLTESRDVSTG